MLRGVEENELTSREVALGPCQALWVGPGQARAEEGRAGAVMAHQQGGQGPGSKEPLTLAWEAEGPRANASVSPRSDDLLSEDTMLTSKARLR